jgi:NADH dehydrogenase (ubiquinone) 1 alpha subcomplex subunit 9
MIGASGPRILSPKFQSTVAKRALSELVRQTVSNRIKYGSGGRSSNSGLTVAVFGCTGFVGRYLLNELGACGTRVYAPFRGDELDTRHLKPMFDLGQLGLIPFSTRDRESIRETLQYADVVVNLIGKHYETKHLVPTRRADGKLSRVNFSLEETHVVVPQTLAEVAKEAGVQNFIQVSALSADVNSASEWSRTKARGEEAVHKIYPDAVIVKLNTIFGPEDRFLNMFAEVTKRLPFFPLINNGSNIVQPVYVNDVGRGLHEIIKDFDDHRGKVFQFSGPADYTYKEIAEFVQDVILTRKPLIDFPASAAELTGTFIEQLISPVWTKDMAAQVLEDVLPDKLGAGYASFKDLNIEPGSMDRLAFDYLHRFRKGGHFALVKGYHTQ